jgi:hypothetical protein
VKAAVSGARDSLLEGRKLWSALLDEPVTAPGGLVVSGMLAEQLARELGSGAVPGAVVTREGTSVAGAEVAVRVIAGDPSDEDVALVESAEREGVPVVLVQLWPQADWTRPFVLTPFVVECKAGQGFPVDEIARRIVEAAEHAPALAGRVPALRDAVRRQVVRGTAVRSALMAALGRTSRPALALEQARALSRLRALDPQAGAAVDPRAAAGVAAFVYLAGHAFRSAARGTRGKAPAPLVDAVLAGAGTWALTRAAEKLQSRVPSS